MCPVSIGMSYMIKIGEDTSSSQVFSWDILVKIRTKELVGYTYLSVCHAFTWGCKEFMGTEQFPIRVMLATMFKLFSFSGLATSKKLCNLITQSGPIIYSPFDYKAILSFKQPDICYFFVLSPSSFCNSLSYSSFF